jgi:4-hydroxymandelate oxidase
MDYKELLDRAREKMTPNCRVCKECNGVVCKGEIPGTGGKGNGNAFKACIDFLASVKINMDTIYKNEGQDTSISLFGRNFKYPFCRHQSYITPLIHVVIIDIISFTDKSLVISPFL